MTVAVRKAPKRSLLIEAKSSCSRPDLRLAIGQLFDYRRGFGAEKVDLVILLPSEPSADDVRLLQSVGIGPMWFADKACTRLAERFSL